MDAKTLKALKGSIAKWKRIAAGKGADHGTDNCPLCQVFRHDDADPAMDCVGCPVRGHTGLSGCQGSPYMAWCFSNPTNGMAKTAKQVRCATAELDFLRSLLPPEPTPSGRAALENGG